MRCAVLGSSGYLGQHLVLALRERGHDVVSPLAAGGKRLDLTNNELVSQVDWGVDVVFMFAGVTGTAAGFGHSERFLLGNELALLNVLNSIRATRYRPRVVFPSTRLVYSGAEGPLREDAEKSGKTIYAINKLACEGYLRVYSNVFDMPYTILRICVPYGQVVGSDYSYGTIGAFVRQARSGKPISLFGGGKPRRTFTHVADVCRLALMAACSRKTINETYNMPGEGLSLRDAAECIANRFGIGVEAAAWPDIEWRIESGDTEFDGDKLLIDLDTSVGYRFSSWVASIPL